MKTGLFLVVTIFVNYSIQLMAGENPHFSQDEISNLKQHLHLAESLKNNIIEFKNGVPQASKWTKLTANISSNQIFENYIPLTNKISSLLQRKQDQQFFNDCYSISQSQQDPTLQLIISDYCTSKITLNSKIKINSKILPENYLYELFIQNARPTEKNRQFLADYFSFLKKKSPLIFSHRIGEISSGKWGIIYSNDKVLLTSLFIKQTIAPMLKNRKKDPNIHRNIYEAITHLKSKSASFTTDDWSEIIRIGKIFSQDKQHDYAEMFFTFAIQQNNQPSLNEDAIFEMIWLYCQNKEYSKAVKFTEEKNLGQIILESESQKLKFWYAVSLLNVDKKIESEKILNKIINLDPFSYYAVMSVKLLGKNSNQNDLSEKIIHSKRLNSTNVDLSKFDNNYKRIWLWSKIDFRLLLNHEHAQLTKLGSSEKEVALFKSYKIMGEAQNYLASFAHLNNDVVKGHTRLSKDALDVMFPTLFWNEMSTHLKGQDPLVLISLIRQESGFNPNARSQVGARGLMQLMPYTARVLDRRIASSGLNKPETNLKLGISFFRMMMEKFDNNLVYVLAAYNAGPHRVLSWQKEHFDLDESILHNIESIPFLETRNYVKLIFRNLFYYKTIHAKDIGKDPLHFNKIFDVHLGFKH